MQHITKNGELDAHCADRNTLYSLALACKMASETFDKAHDAITTDTPEAEESRRLFDEQARHYIALWHELKEEFRL